MKLFLHISSIVIVAHGIVMGIRGDMETFRFEMILGMLCNIYAEIID